MGYRSDVALKAQFTTITDRDRVIAMLPEEQQTLVREMVTIPTDRPVLYARYNDIKWYASSIMDGYQQIDAVEALLSLCEHAADGTLDGTTDTIPNVGFFARIGEDTSDSEERYWEPSWTYQERPDYNLPSPYDMGQIQRIIVTDEE